MGILQDFERGLEGAVEGFFGKVFRSRLQPIELAKALQRYADTHKVVTGKDVLAQNAYRIIVGTKDHARLAQMEGALERELAEVLRRTAVERRWQLRGPVHVDVEVDDAVHVGMFEITGRVDERRRADAGPTPAAPPSSTRVDLAAVRSTPTPAQVAPEPTPAYARDRGAALPATPPAFDLGPPGTAAPLFDGPPPLPPVAPPPPAGPVPARDLPLMADAPPRPPTGPGPDDDATAGGPGDAAAVDAPGADGSRDDRRPHEAAATDGGADDDRPAAPEPLFPDDAAASADGKRTATATADDRPEAATPAPAPTSGVDTPGSPGSADPDRVVRLHPSAPSPSATPQAPTPATPAPEPAPHSSATAAPAAGGHAPAASTPAPAPADGPRPAPAASSDRSPDRGSLVDPHPRLTVTSGHQRGQQADLRSGRLVVGRHRDCGLRLEDATVSREHATLLRRGATWWVLDMHSTNGTTVNGVTAAEQPLADGDVIAVGDVALTFAKA